MRRRRHQLYSVETINRLTCLVVLVLWAGVTVFTFGFHHHAPDSDDCEKNNCPFSLVFLNLPWFIAGLAVFLFVLPRQNASFHVLLLKEASFISTPSVRAPPVLKCSL